MTSELISGVAGHLIAGHSASTAVIADQASLIDVLVCPPAPYLAEAFNAKANSNIKIGAQNVNAHASGAFTGEISLPMLAELGCEYVLLGHSERREIFAETDAQIAEKFAACVNADESVTPILCIGETLAQRQSGNTEAVIAEQLDAAIQATGISGFDNAVVAYEPVWAIGTGETASPEQAQQVHEFIRKKLAKLNEDIAAKLQILYGGSMKPGNAKDLLAQPDIDGGLIGGAALQVESFAGICEAAIELSAN